VLLKKPRRVDLGFWWTRNPYIPLGVGAPPGVNLGDKPGEWGWHTPGETQKKAVNRGDAPA